MSKDDIMIKDHESKLNGILSSVNTITSGGFESETKYILSQKDSNIDIVCTLMRFKSFENLEVSVVYEILTTTHCSAIVTTIKEKKTDYTGGECYVTYNNYR